MSATTIRAPIISELKTISGLGGTEQRIHKFFFESDDVKEVEAYWKSTQGAGFPGAGTQVINATMLSRTDRRERETTSGGVKLFFRIHTFRLRFRYGRHLDPKAEETFEAFLESILDLFEGNDAIFKTPGINIPGSFHPQPDADQIATATVTNKRIFHFRVWEADIVFDIVEHVRKV